MSKGKEMGAIEVARDTHPGEQTDASSVRVALENRETLSRLGREIEFMVRRLGKAKARVFGEDPCTEILQETIVLALSTPSYEPGHRSLAWLKAIARNVINGKLRKWSMISRIKIEYIIVFETIDRCDQVVADVREILSQLSPRHRRVLVLHYFEGLSGKNLAETEKTPTANAAHQLLSRAREEFRSRWKRD
jgi:RNA polymerase sigma-70 factor (ECF subfamily)